MNDPIEFTPFEQQLTSALRKERLEPTPACFDLEEMLDIIEEGEKHPRYTALQSHLATCALCSDEYAQLNQTWQEARKPVPHTSPEVLPPQAEAQTSPRSPSMGAVIGEWLRRLAAGRARVQWAWGVAVLLVLLTGWTLWQGQRMRTELRTAQARWQSDQTHIAADQINIQQLQKRLVAADAARQKDAQEAQSKLTAANNQIQDLQRKILKAYNDFDKNQLLTSTAGLQVSREITRDSGGVRLRSPRSTCVLEKRPRFEWTLDNPLPAGTEYEITIAGDGYHRVKSLHENADQWDMARESEGEFPSLKRGKIYRWRISIRVAGDTPKDSATAIFKIAPQETVNRIAQARREGADHPLSLIKAYLESGLLDQARHEFNVMLDRLQKPAPPSEH